MNHTFTLQAASQGPRHHFFGFHDLSQWNAAGDLMLALGVEDISHPPMANEPAESGVLHPQEKIFVPIHQTTAYNYPQGARQQWIGATDLFLCNDRIGEEWGMRIVDARSRAVIDTLPFPCHCLNAVTGDAFSINYSRLYRVGGYGYIGIQDPHLLENIPSACGIFVGNIHSGKRDLMVSIRQAASVDEPNLVDNGWPHYLTHLLLNPGGTRLAFLHRYNVPDGGVITRLMTVRTDGTDLRVLAKGFLSHFDWLNDNEIIIWGKNNRSTDRLRESRLGKLPGFQHGLKIAKRILHGINHWLNDRPRPHGYTFLGVSDSDPVIIRRIGAGTLTEDGHPMVCPVGREWLINDTYPDSQGIRTLMLFNCASGERIDIGRFKMLNKRPDPTEVDSRQATQWVDRQILNTAFGTDQFLFTRSGFHCDLHPRWRRDGKAVSFDSIHEGSRQVYTVEINWLSERNL